MPTGSRFVGAVFYLKVSSAKVLSTKLGILYTSDAADEEEGVEEGGGG